MNWIRLKGTTVPLSAALIVAVSGLAQMPKDTRTNPEREKGRVESPVLYQGVRYQSESRRDPFLSPVSQKKDQKPQDEEVSRGQAPPGIGGMNVAQVALLGIVARDSATSAIFRGTDGRAYFLRAGDKLFDGFVSRIDADSVTLIRETRYTSGKFVKQEVTKRLRPQ